MRTAIYLLISTILISCSTDYKNNLIGEWYRSDNWINTGIIDTTPKLSDTTEEPYYSKPAIYYPFGFVFLENDSVEYQLGNWQKIDNEYKYIGQYRFYNIKTDSLFIYDLNNKLHEKFKMIFKSNDTLLLNKSGKKITFVRFKSDTLKHISIDSIRINKRNGWGLNIEYKVSKNGNISYRNKSTGEDVIDTLITGSINRDVFCQIELKYLKSNFINLSNYKGCCDNFSFTTRIFYNGGKVKQIYDYENSSPMNFIWANKYLISIIESNLEILN